ncbi:bifunctional riboflavin kinase/FAD synthetase [Flammeovirga kamogawensis]|uniref:Riboflavin biosynthesis protein n=1 Tax=Flammeovirga kamogawensis TaxID=373891 RepID=A0ABX8H0U7_9BACT|nr:bifunctional riboflavin kinase/FAD synthetase [Flammeovirga kamogawensis]MBB6459460.1 riboflavin kinase/FMN adenylyltransferase [Flammeovirga kamogawensis]QWG09012.1 bifunctional riboflavin kinase/FAD synthetase [Flammeovirga kamogawensis]TRX67300.1 bifunctional riboflavin kinase/FAD synthetase [Flammeovirga kamogawensis]
MKVHYGIDNFTPLKRATVTSGTFDGVHYGHQQILAHLRKTAREDNSETVLITFWPHPRFVLQPEIANKSLKLLTNLDEKIALLEQEGIDHLIVIEFNKEFSHLTSMEFVKNILIDKINTTKLVIGYDHRFGRNREGGFDYLKEHQAEFGFEVEEITKQEIENAAVSSTAIRAALIEEGDLFTAEKYLGYHYSLEGIVVDGNKIGRKIGFPTANIQLKDSFKLLPHQGVYAVHLYFKGVKYKGMLNIGNRPTVTEGIKKTVEVNIFDFNEDIYGAEVRLEFIKRIRPEMKFDGVEMLIEQLHLDKESAITALSM